MRQSISLLRLPAMRDEMSKDDQTDNEDYLSPKDLRSWGEQEIKDLARAVMLRTHEIREMVDAYSAGQISPEKADELQWRYLKRWGEALPGVIVSDGMTDTAILARIDQAREPYKSPRETRDQYNRLFRKTPGEDDRSR
jgi:hypothetical protein